MGVAPAASAGRSEVFYLSTDDCFYCQHWEATRKPTCAELAQSAQAR